MRRASTDDSLRCSFCHKSERVVGRLISSPSDYPRAYICDECVAVCGSIIEDDRLAAAGVEPDLPDSQPHALLSHPRASELMGAVEAWIREESLGNDGVVALVQVRSMAERMMTELGK